MHGSEKGGLGSGLLGLKEGWIPGSEGGGLVSGLLGLRKDGWVLDACL